MLIIVNLALLGLHLVSILFALFCGRVAERFGAGILICGTAATWTAQATVGLDPLPVYMSIDLLTAIGFGVLALRFPDKLWPGIAGCSIFLIFVFSATRWIDYPLREDVYIVAKNLSALGIASALILGTWRARWGKPRLDEWEEYASMLSARASAAP